MVELWIYQDNPPDESDEDYRQRLVASGKTVYDDKIAEDDE